MKDMFVFTNNFVATHIFDDEIKNFLVGSLNLDTKTDIVHCNYIDEHILEQLPTDLMEASKFWDGIAFSHFQSVGKFGVHINPCIAGVGGNMDYWIELMSNVKDVTLYLEFPYPLYLSICNRLGENPFDESAFEHNNASIRAIVEQMSGYHIPDKSAQH